MSNENLASVPRSLYKMFQEETPGRCILFTRNLKKQQYKLAWPFHSSVPTLISICGNAYNSTQKVLELKFQQEKERSLCVMLSKKF